MKEVTNFWVHSAGDPQTTGMCQARSSQHHEAAEGDSSSLTQF